MATFGEFFDALMKWAREDGYMYAEPILTEWAGSVPQEQWETERTHPLTEAELTGMLIEIEWMFRQKLLGPDCTRRLFRRRMGAKRECQRAIRRIARTFDVKTRKKVRAVPRETISLVFEEGSA